jgi:hypothetical protein
MATVEALKSYPAELSNVNGNDSRCNSSIILVLLLNKQALLGTLLGVAISQRNVPARGHYGIAFRVLHCEVLTQGEDFVRRSLPVPLHSIVCLFALLTISAAPVMAQRTVTNDAGSGRKIVLHYNSADQITETDTLGPNGEVLEKDLLQYRPNAYTPNNLRTAYWPNGKPHKITENTYDDNSNYLTEYIQVFDESGKQIGGHKLTHDPMTNVFHCAEWTTATQNYVARECPEGEESEGAPETVKKFTEQEVTQQLERARQAAKAAAAPAPMSGPGGATNVKEVGFILPSHVRPGERVSGSVVENPADYEKMSQLIVTRFALPFGAGQTATLAGWSVEISGEPPQPADGAIALTIPPGQLELAVMFRAAGNVGAPVSHAIAIPRVTRESKALQGWLAPATCLKDQVCMVHGTFTGNSNKTFAAIENRPARILAETTTAAYLAVPAKTETGPRPLVIAEGAKAIAFPMVISAASVQPDTRTLKAGEQLVVYLQIDGAEEIPDGEWRPGNFPPSNLELARQLIPGYKLPSVNKKDEHEAEERREKAEKANGKPGAPAVENDEGEGGEILLVAKVSSADDVSFRGANNGMYVFRLHRDSFKTGAFKYKFIAGSAKGGSFQVQPYLIPMLAPQPGQEFAINPNAVGQ